MNLSYVVLGSIVVFAICFNLLYAANFPLEKRYKQFLLPVVALLTCIPFLQLDDSITRLYEQFLGEKMPFLISYIQLLLNLTFLFVLLSVKLCWKIVGSLSFKTIGTLSKFRWSRKIMTLLS